MPHFDFFTWTCSRLNNFGYFLDKDFLNEVRKIGRFLNASIQQNILIQSEMVELIGKRLNGVEAVLKRILINNRLRNKDF